MQQSLTVIKDSIYPNINTSMKKNENKFKQCFSRFMEKRHTDLFDIAPCSRIYFGSDDLEDFYKSTSIDKNLITEKIKNTYYYPMPNFNPSYAKNEDTIAILCVVRYFFMAKKQKELELSLTYLAFSGNFYPSVHYGSFPTVQPSEHRHIMEYVINNGVDNRFDIKKEGNIFNVIKKICNTWKDTYSEKLRNFDDEDIVYILQQLRDRIKSFMQKIASVYYDVYSRKDTYMTYDSDNLSQDNYHLADNDSMKTERHVEKAMSVINNSSIDYSTCIKASDSNVRATELKEILESILQNSENINTVKELIRILVTMYFIEDPKKDITNIKFVTFSLTAKPNSKNDMIIREKEIIENWLTMHSEKYKFRKKREATKNSYFRAVLSYFTLITYNSNK